MRYLLSSLFDRKQVISCCSPHHRHISEKGPCIHLDYKLVGTGGDCSIYIPARACSAHEADYSKTNYSTFGPPGNQSVTSTTSYYKQAYEIPNPKYKSEQIITSCKCLHGNYNEYMNYLLSKATYEWKFTDIIDYTFKQTLTRNIWTAIGFLIIFLMIYYINRLPYEMFTVFFIFELLLFIVMIYHFHEKIFQLLSYFCNSI